MDTEAHLEKFARFEKCRLLLDPLEDFELWYWSLLSAGTAIINAALHATGITHEDDSFATQVPDVYAVPDSPSTWHHEIRHLVDLIHVGMPQIDADLPGPLKIAFHEMEAIEQYRDPCVRADRAADTAVVETIAMAYERCIEATRRALAR